MFFSLILRAVSKKALPLPLILVLRFRIYGRVMKRESGVNPEQTRCCKLRQKSLNNTQIHCSAMNGKDDSKME